jgi:6-phosphogluconolactonase
VDGSTGQWTHVQLLPDLINPSFLAFDRTGKFLYTVHGDLSEVSAFSVDEETGQLTRLNTAGTEGKNPVHLAIDPSKRYLVLANHITSTVALMSRNEDGSIGSVVDLVTLKGAVGPHRKEQPFAKPHQVEFDPSGKFIAVPDKGLDQIFVFQIDAASQSLKPVGEPVVAREGSGPRHIAFHPRGNLAYVINELDSSVASYRFDPETGALVPFQVISALPDTYTGNSRAAEIAVSSDGRFVYASNRGSDSIIILSIEQETGRVTPVAWQSSEGKTPRFFALDPNGERLFVANEDSDIVVPFAVNQQEGTLKQSGDPIQVGSPVCIVFKLIQR